MSVYKFFYDESGNSREINQNTVTANNYSDNFITAIVGWDSSRDKEIEEEYAAFESKYSYRMSAGEIKSSSIKDKQIRNGFASTNKETTQFLLDYLTVMENVSLYFCVMSKIEYVVWQLFDNYRGVPFILEKNFMYSLVKAINVYRPQTVIDCIYNHPEDLVDVLEDFLCQRIEANKDNPSLKSRESHVFEQIIGLLTDVSLIRNLRWEYRIPFEGFLKYLNERSITSYSLVIDREGTKQETFSAAASVGIVNVSEEDSKNFVGIRMADMMAGLIGKLMKSLYVALTPTRGNETQKTLLPLGWFAINEQQLALYKRLHHVLTIVDNSWYKSYAGNYADDLVTFIALLDYMSSFSNVDEMKKDYKMHSEKFNSLVCGRLAQRYQKG